jgi:hypothetical protein
MSALGPTEKYSYGESCILFFKKEAFISMPIFKYFAVVGSALLLLIFASDAYFGDDESNLRFNGSLSESAIYAPRLEKSLVTATRTPRKVRWPKWWTENP